MLKKLLIAAIFCAIPLQFTAVNAMKEEKNLYEVEVSGETENKISTILENIKSRIRDVENQLARRKIPKSNNIIPNVDKMEMLNKMKELVRFITSNAYYAITNIMENENKINDENVDLNIYTRRIMKKLNKYAYNVKLLEGKLFEQYERERTIRVGLLDYDKDKATEYLNIRNQVDDIEEKFSKIENKINSNPKETIQQETRTELEELREKMYTLRQNSGYNFLYNTPFSDTDKKLDKIQNKITKLLN